MITKQDRYIKELEETINKFMVPLRDIPFSVAIKAISGCDVLSFNRQSSHDKRLLNLIIEAIKIAGAESYKAGIFTNRPNEAGNEIEPFIKKALLKVGLKAETPVTKKGSKKATGYPDIEITDNSGSTTYLECKTYNISNIDTTQRAFYFSPSKDFKVTKDAIHLMISFQIKQENRKGRIAFIPTHWRLYTLENLVVDIKHEFNQSNRKLYGSGSDLSSLLAEDDV